MSSQKAIAAVQQFAPAKHGGVSFVKELTIGLVLGLAAGGVWKVCPWLLHLPPPPPPVPSPASQSEAIALIGTLPSPPCTGPPSHVLSFDSGGVNDTQHSNMTTIMHPTPGLTLCMLVQVQHLNEKRKIGEYYITLEKIAAEKGPCSPPQHAFVMST